MNDRTEAVPPSAFTPGGRHRHRKSKQLGAGARRALVLAMAVPVASAALAGPSAFAANGKTTATAPDAAPATDEDLDPADQAIAANLDTRINDARLGGNVSGVVLDAESDSTVWDHNGATALMPASNTKLATATAALTVLGPNHRFKTKVVYGDGTLTLVGGGDRTLTTADLAAMAKDAVAGLKAAGLTTVKVAVDDSLFSDSTQAHGWKPDYFPGDVAPVRALVVDGHAVNDTSIDAGQVFAKQLADAGVTLDGEVTRRTAEITDVPVARHRSAPLSDIVHRMIKVSDNNIAETLLRMTALGAGQPATFEGGTAVVRDVLSRRYGVSLENFQIYDGSGLSRANRIPARTLAEILDLLTEKRYEHLLSSIRDGLPVAGEAGSTLGPEWGRFDDENSKCAVGKVHAKTGTLTGAIALSGLTVGKDGRWKVFSFVENDSTAGNSAIKDAMDGLAATVNGCWA
ncbi:D-alanyl-D-alanine carboxypeptidase/D-alanyl-D-alanine endopeptidase [Streptomyces neyagawaensis]|uniref:D-alanyl-D-alanine carboxypeptidase/D-alanyl-D-alanine endopeptidase n=1 Tax=Streptomyces neyagawaensis TaxID=42238 RepID=UPI0006E2445D|nr:D-alanyl-D-alanine carboxypeptidase/D-alanyl-D-alanine-endopeptidase [Streptomyces neyagawaensis]MCL6732565.1 D-alanyl-D-alanine carboxypeptidase/D-alanyl-D-alanine-endopeptidase [Streptomyces neyagawaensis]MDE1687204.1 D-alanyl-D-alanine carboxypeptidase/D-alanyl-D-alanine-endopeptidase [Streptomyces neyagawaensis]